jgi:hypothetical protein
MTRVLVVAGALALAGCTGSNAVSQSRQARADAELADALKGRVAGEPVTCISTVGVTRGPQIIDRKTILYRDGRRIWRNTLETECPRLEPLNTIVIELYGSQMCQNDRFRMVEPGLSIPGPYCRLGKFVPYTKP